MRAFCGAHDARAFRRLETVPFDGGDEQVFLLVYRATCWELYQKQRAARGVPVLKRHLDRGRAPDVQWQIQSMLAAQEAGFARGLVDLRARKAGLDLRFTNREYGGRRFSEFRFVGPPSIVSTGAINPTFSLSGRDLQVLHDAQNPLQWLAFGCEILPSGDEFAIWFSWDDDAHYCTSYMEEVDSLSDSKICAFLPQFFFAHCENTYFAADWWHHISRSAQEQVASLTANPNPYYSPPDYDLESSLTSWTVVHRRTGTSNMHQT